MSIRREAVQYLKLIIKDGSSATIVAMNNNVTDNTIPEKLHCLLFMLVLMKIYVCIYKTNRKQIRLEKQ